MKKCLLLLFALVTFSSSAYSACDPTRECVAANLCYGDGGISCTQQQRCEVAGGRAKWAPIPGDGNICNRQFKIKILDVVCKAQMDSRVVSETDKVAAKCDDNEVCSFTPKVAGNPSGGLYGDPTPGSHCAQEIKYICRDSRGTKGVVRLNIPYDKDTDPVSFNCIE